MSGCPPPNFAIRALVMSLVVVSVLTAVTCLIGSTISSVSTTSSTASAFSYTTGSLWRTAAERGNMSNPAINAIMRLISGGLNF